MAKKAERAVDPQASDAGSLKRGVQILKILAITGTRGLALTEIAARAGLPHPTAHRVLRQLVEERLVARNDELKRYRLGPLGFELGIAGSTLYDMRDLCSGPMEAVADETGDTAYLVVRSGFDAVCLHRHEGEFPIRALVLDIGGRRPLGVGAGGLALLAAVGLEERRQIIERVSRKLDAYGGMTAGDLERACDRTRKADGMAVVQGTLSLGVSAVGHAFFDAMGQPVGALSVVALSHRMSRERVLRIHELLKDACVQVQRRMNLQHLNGWKTGV